MFEKTVAELSALLKAKKVSSVELTQGYLDRISKYKGLNAFISVDRERSLAKARAADALLAKGQAGPLAGMPVAQKDIFCADGWLTTCGSKMLSNFVAPYNATVIERFNAAGCVNLGKTNMDEFAMGSSNETSFYGPVKNPWAQEAVPGGSSGGSAAAVAARLAPAATGTDTGGSIRQPAALTGITGIKPSYGRVSRYCMIAFASSLDQGGPMTRTAEDAALLLNVMCGFDPRDSTSVDQPVPDFTTSLTKSIKGLRIGLPKEYFGAGLSADVARSSSPRLPSTGNSAPSWSRSRCPTRSLPSPAITCWPRPRRRATWRASTVCATATAPRSTRTWSTCTAGPAPKASAPRSSAAS